MKKAKVKFRVKKYGTWKTREVKFPEEFEKMNEISEYIIDELNEELSKLEQPQKVREITIKIL